MLNETEKLEIERQAAHYPLRSAACIEVLKDLQRTKGWISDETLAEVADLLGMTIHELDNVATYYNLIFRRAVGRHVILLCDSVSCWLLESDRLKAELTRHLGIEYGQTTPDERFTLLPIACLGACDRAPAIMIDEDLHGPVELNKLEQILAHYK